MGPTAAILPGNRLHLQHGPIDLVIGAGGPADQVKAAYVGARDRFQTILPVLVEELSALRRPVQPGQHFDGPVARRMAEVVSRHADVFVTPMAAVAGSVADEMLATMRTSAPALQKIWVNNGGDIAVHLSGDATFEAAMIADPVTGREAGKLTLRASDGVGGIATSGRHGRSLSLGIADAVTVLAVDAASADVAATLIANAVDLPRHPAIHRVPAREIDPDSDLGERPVVVEVGVLSDVEVLEALERGASVANRVLSDNLIKAAWLNLGHACTTTTHINGPSLDLIQGSSSSSIPHWTLGSSPREGGLEMGRLPGSPFTLNRPPEFASQIGGDTLEQEARHALT